jgi:hypothetical protein
VNSSFSDIFPSGTTKGILAILNEQLATVLSYVACFASGGRTLQWYFIKVGRIVKRFGIL